jgi:hypothetical protein
VAIIPTSSTSERRRPLLLPALLLLTLASVVGTADARRPRKGKKKPEPAPVEAPAPPPRPVTPPVALFPASLPLSVGGVVPGLANSTAQACAGCHFDSHAAWADSAHADGWRSPRFQRAVAEAGTPACTTCHLPFLEQSAVVVDYDGGDLDKPLTAANPGFDASLRMEGVTCAACHVRDGKVVGTRPPEEFGPIPHPMAWSEDLGSDEACATCHQLTWEGANTAFYDTYGEWKASMYADAGVGCVDCHGGAGAGKSGFDHGMDARTGTGLSILVDLPGVTLVRGEDAVPVKVVLQNTGAGHSYPTGSPFTGARVRVRLVGPPDRRGEPTEKVALEHDLRRTLTEGPPWDVVEDTRVPAGGQTVLETELSIPYGEPEGAWALHVEILGTSGGEPLNEPPRTARILPLVVE